VVAKVELSAALMWPARQSWWPGHETTTVCLLRLLSFNARPLRVQASRCACQTALCQRRGACTTRHIPLSTALPSPLPRTCHWPKLLPFLALECVLLASAITQSALVAEGGWARPSSHSPAPVHSRCCSGCRDETSVERHISC
jgi:hypothetical protein